MATSPVTIEQRITAGSQFTGAAHTSVPTTDQDTGIQKFATNTVGGLFVFAITNVWLTEVQRIMGDFADAATVSIVILNADADVISIYEAIEGGDVLITDRIQLASDEQIRIITTGATAAMVARVVLRPLLATPAS